MKPIFVLNLQENDAGNAVLTKYLKKSDILKVDFFARSKLQFSNFAQEKVEKYH